MQLFIETIYFTFYSTACVNRTKLQPKRVFQMNETDQQCVLPSNCVSSLSGLESSLESAEIHGSTLQTQDMTIVNKQPKIPLLNQSNATASCLNDPFDGRIKEISAR